MILELINFAMAPVQTELIAIRKETPNICQVDPRRCTPRKPLQKEHLESGLTFVIATNTKPATKPTTPETPYRGGRLGGSGEAGGGRQRQPSRSKMNGGTEGGKGYTPPNNGGPDNGTERGGRNAGSGTRIGSKN